MGRDCRITPRLWIPYDRLCDNTFLAPRESFFHSQQSIRPTKAPGLRDDLGALARRGSRSLPRREGEADLVRFAPRDHSLPTLHGGTGTVRRGEGVLRAAFEDAAAGARCAKLGEGRHLPSHGCPISSRVVRCTQWRDSSLCLCPHSIDGPKGRPPGLLPKTTIAHSRPAVPREGVRAAPRLLATTVLPSSRPRRPACPRSAQIRSSTSQLRKSIRGGAPRYGPRPDRSLRDIRHSRPFARSGPPHCDRPAPALRG
jgi:hypothetical protein